MDVKFDYSLITNLGKFDLELLNLQILVYYKRTSEKHIIRQHTVWQMLVIHNADILPQKNISKYSWKP